MKEWNVTALTRRLGISQPIVQGPFGRGNSSARLVAAVSNAGGLGSFGANDLEPEAIVKTASEIRALTGRPFALNLWVSTHDQGGDVLAPAAFDRVADLLAPYFDELGLKRPTLPAGKARNFEAQVAAVLEARPAVLSFVFGIPSPEILGALKERGIVTVGGATTVEEAVALEKAGVEAVVAAGSEGGGHRPSFLRPVEDSLVGTMALVPQIVDRVGIPVIAAGGIADGRGVAAALVLGASAVQIGTAFLACDESGAPAAHRELLFTEAAHRTGLSRAFTGRLARGIENRYAAEMRRHEGELPGYPAQGWISSQLRAAALEQGRLDLIGLWAGQAAALVRHRKAADLMAALVQEVDGILG